MKNIININNSNFDINVFNSKYPVLVDFWAEWCGPCKIISKNLNDISKDFINKIIIAKINVEENPKILKKYDIRSIPTLILFKKKIIIGRTIGIMSKEKIKEFIYSNL